MNKQSKQTVVVFGSSQPKPGSSNYECAQKLGVAIAQAGYVLANGGYSGTMAGSAQGAKSVDGKTIGITCKIFNRNGKNEWIDEEIYTENLNQRLDKLIELGDAYITLPGSTGTLLELAMVWELMNKKFLPQRPFFCLGDYWKPVVETIVQSGETDGQQILFTDSIDEIITNLNETWR